MGHTLLHSHAHRRTHTRTYGHTHRHGHGHGHGNTHGQTRTRASPPSPAVAGDVVDPEGVAHVLLPLVLVLAEAGEDVDLVQLGIYGGPLGEARHGD